MDGEPSLSNQMASTNSRLIPVVVPVLLISVGFIDPGKWAASIDAGTRFGFDLMLPMMIFSSASILCQYLASRVGVVTGKDLTQICHAEYDTATCMILGVQAELSAIALDLTLVMGIAHCLSHILGVDLVTSMFLTALEAVAFPFISNFMEKHTGKLASIYMAFIVCVCYFIGLLVSQPDTPLSLNWMAMKLSGESVFALMSLLGACIMPHNFYLHAALVQHQGPQNISKSVLCHDHLSAILCIFSCMFLVNLALMNSAANVFYSSGFVLLNFHDALSLMDRVYRSSIAPFALMILFFVSNHINTSSWSISGKAIVHNLFGADMPSWFHRAIVRVTAIFFAICCIWNSGAEGLYQLLIFVQVLIALMLPSSLIPLFRVASSGQIMGAYKVSQLVEFLSVSTFVGILATNVLFMIEMLFGSSDWVSSLRWNMGTNTSVPYAVLLTTSIFSLAFMLWLAATPLKSASVGLDSFSLNWETREAAPPNLQKEELFYSENRRHIKEPDQKEDLTTAQGNSLDRQPERFDPAFDVSLPDSLDYGLSSIPEKSDDTHPDLPAGFLEVTTSSTVVSQSIMLDVNLENDQKLVDVKSLRIESAEPIEKIVRYEKEDEDGDIWEPDEPSRGITAGNHTTTNTLAISEGPGSFRSLSGKNEDGGSGIGSLSRLAGLGRAARRQLAVILDEFWGQMYDYHGQPTQEAKARRPNLLFGSELKPPNSMPKMEPVKEHTSFYQTAGGRGTGSLSGVYNSPQQQRVPSSLESPYAMQKASSMDLSFVYSKEPSSLWSNSNNLPDSFGQTSGRNALDTHENSYCSLRAPPSSDMWDRQPATVHGYQISQYLNQYSKDRDSDYSMDSRTIASSNMSPVRYKDYNDFGLSQKLQNSLNPIQTSLLHNLAISRNASMQSETSPVDLYSSGPGEVVGPVGSKKYNSMPDIKGLSAAQRDLYANSRNSFGNNSIGTGQSFGRVSYDPSSYSTAGSRNAGPLAFDHLSPNPFAQQYVSCSGTGSLWSRQPFEQFGVADKIHNIESDGSRNRAALPEVGYIVDFEAKLLQSLRHCIVRILKLEGSDWLFKQNDGADEDLIERAAAREKFLNEVEDRMSDSQQSLPELSKLISSVPNCGEGCVWKADLLVSFGVWCIHRILDLSLMESRPELWGKYTYVLNRLQGIIDLAFSKPRVPASPCFCLQVPETHRPKSTPPATNGMLPPASKPGRGKCTTAPMVMDMIKDVEIAISCRKGRSGTAAGDVAFPKGKENLASVLKRYKRRLAKKPAKLAAQDPNL